MNNDNKKKINEEKELVAYKTENVEDSIMKCDSYNEDSTSKNQSDFVAYKSEEKDKIDVNTKVEPIKIDTTERKSVKKTSKGKIPVVIGMLIVLLGGFILINSKEQSKDENNNESNTNIAKDEIENDNTTEDNNEVENNNATEDNNAVENSNDKELEQDKENTNRYTYIDSGIEGDAANLLKNLFNEYPKSVKEGNPSRMYQYTTPEGESRQYYDTNIPRYYEKNIKVELLDYKIDTIKREANGELRITCTMDYRITNPDSTRVQKERSDYMIIVNEYNEVLVDRVENWALVE